MHFQSSGRPDEDTHFTHAGDDFMVMSTPAPHADPLDDVFGSGDASPVPERDPSAPSHPSDMHRLRSEHATAGYREGLTAAKESTLQAGFDEGFTLGATIGLEAGRLLGLLEGIGEAIDGLAKEQFDLQLAEARQELHKSKVFGTDYWAPDGNWKYDVSSADGGQDDDVVFADVARCHPLIRKWAAVADQQIATWKIDVSLLDDETTPRLEASSPPDEQSAVAGAPVAMRQPLEW